MFSHRVTGSGTDSPAVGARLRIWARPGSRRAGIAWDPWRKRWTVSVLAPAAHGQANEAIVAALAERLGVARSSIRWVHGGTSASKEVEVAGLSELEVERRLSGAVRGPG
jgi:uncharacterized protein (TIGR00251 family)